jgi:hypothetical protein
VQIVAAYPLNVRLPIHPENVRIAYGKNVAVGFQCNARIIII